MELSVSTTITIKFTASEFRMMCLALDEKAPRTESDRKVMRELSGKMLAMRTDRLDDLSNASAHAEDMHNADEKEPTV